MCRDPSALTERYAKREKPKQVTVLQHAAGIEIPILFDANEDALEFIAMVGDVRFTAKTAQDVKDRVEEFLDDSTKLNWTAVIDVRHGFVWRDETNTVRLDASRYWFSTTPDGQHHAIE
jgi:hypothetical protein